MEERSQEVRSAQAWVSRQVESKGLRPRFAAYLIASVWLAGVIVFGIVEHLVDPDTFPNIWLGMWWALQTVTTVGYGDIVPASTAGKLFASILLLGGLSLLAVVTGVVTSAFVTQAQARRSAARGDPVLLRLEAISRDIAALRAELDRLQGSGSKP